MLQDGKNYLFRIQSTCKKSWYWKELKWHVTNITTFSGYSWLAATTAPESLLHPPEAPTQRAYREGGSTAAYCKTHRWVAASGDQWNKNTSCCGSCGSIDYLLFLFRVILPPKEKGMEAMALKWWWRRWYGGLCGSSPLSPGPLVAGPQLPGPPSSCPVHSHPAYCKITAHSVGGSCVIYFLGSFFHNQ